MSFELRRLNAEHYRRKAQYYLLFARQMTDPNAKAALLDLAGHWIQMARQWEQEDLAPKPRTMGPPRAVG